MHTDKRGLTIAPFPTALHPPSFPSEGQKSFFPILCTQLHLLISPESVCADKSGQLVCRVPVQDSCSIVYSLPAAAPLQQYPDPRANGAGGRQPGSLSLPTANLWHARDFAAKKTFFFLIQINKSKVLAPSFPPSLHPAPKRGGRVGAALVKEVSGPLGGRMREGKKGTSAHYFGWLWNSLSRHCEVLIQQSQPKTMAC